MDQPSIERTINKRLDEFMEKLSEHIVHDVKHQVKYELASSPSLAKIDKVQETVAEFIKNDQEWKKKLEPLINVYESATSLQKFLIGLAKLILAVSAACAAIWAFFKFIVIAAIK